MPSSTPSNRWPRIAAWAVASVFLLGFFFPLLGAWTGAILGAWLVGTQRPVRGFLSLFALAFLPSLISNWRKFPLTSPQVVLQYVGWMLLVAVLSALPFVFHRLTSPRLPGFLSTLPLPLAGAALEALAMAWLPTRIFNLYSLAHSQQANTPLLHIAADFGIGAITFFIFLFAAVLLWMWNHEFRAAEIATGASLFAAVCGLATGFGLFRQFTGAALPAGTAFAWICLDGATILSVQALFYRDKLRRPWADRPEIALLQSPVTGEALHAISEEGREALVSSSGERFPIRDGMPVFLKPEEITGANLKYNHLYETIGGFYDDIQRVVCALSGIDRDAYVMSYLGLLEIKPGDSVLETSVGTGLNLKYLPRDIQRFGLDLSREMLLNCQANLRRWEMDADLFRGNAESLPFADSSMDVVFHTGGINFFSDRAKAISEMIRVAKPGSLILIADETEEHVKGTFERSPIAGGYYRGRKEKVTAPVDLLPADVQEIRVDSVFKNRFYALTFRKPASAAVPCMVRE
jgi:ubiquinone/menaquinone biosynthesis C-methylase UbiE/uncharacterized protein YbaR (Trm112 family)